MVANELDFVKSHDLILLLDICMRKAPSLSAIKKDCSLLNGIYIETRYPVHWPANNTKQESLTAKKSAEKIAEIIKALLKTE